MGKRFRIGPVLNGLHSGPLFFAIFTHNTIAPLFFDNHV